MGLRCITSFSSPATPRTCRIQTLKTFSRYHSYLTQQNSHRCHWNTSVHGLGKGQLHHWWSAVVTRGMPNIDFWTVYLLTEEKWVICGTAPVTGERSLRLNGKKLSVGLLFVTLKVSSHKHHEFQWLLCFVTSKSHLWAEYPALRSVKPANSTSASEHKVFLYLQTRSQSLWKARSLLLVEVDPGFYGNCWILRTWNAICGSGTERHLWYLDNDVCIQGHPFPAAASPNSHHKPYFLERKNRHRCL